MHVMKLGSDDFHQLFKTITRDLQHLIWLEIRLGKLVLDHINSE